MSEIEKKESGEWKKQREEMLTAIKEAKKSQRPKTANEPTIEFRGWVAEKLLLYRISFSPKDHIVAIVHT